MDYKKIFSELEKFDTPTICNALEAFDNRFRLTGYGKPGMFLRSKDEKPMVGFAVTAKVAAKAPQTKEQGALRSELYREASKSETPSIVCIQDTDAEPIGSFWGEMQASIFSALGAIGTITEGGVRDIDCTDHLPFRFYSTCIQVSHANIHVEAVSVPVLIRGQIINPGDIIHCDKHGFAVIPAEYVERLAKACEDMAGAEEYLLAPLREAAKNGTRPDVEDIIKWNKACAEARKAIKV